MLSLAMAALLKGVRMGMPRFNMPSEWGLRLSSPFDQCSRSTNTYVSAFGAVAERNR